MTWCRLTHPRLSTLCWISLEHEEVEVMEELIAQFTRMDERLESLRGRL